jgi:hypothetical protein
MKIKTSLLKLMERISRFRLNSLNPPVHVNTSAEVFTCTGGFKEFNRNRDMRSMSLRRLVFIFIPR